MNVTCFGDSNTYGYDPRSWLGDRYDPQNRWVDILAGKTGWNISNRGQNGREIPRQPVSFPAEDRKSTRLNSSHNNQSRMPSSA